MHYWTVPAGTQRIPGYFDISTTPPHRAQLNGVVGDTPSSRVRSGGGVAPPRRRRRPVILADTAMNGRRQVGAGQILSTTPSIALRTGQRRSDFLPPPVAGNTSARRLACSPNHRRSTTVSARADLVVRPLGRRASGNRPPTARFRSACGGNRSPPPHRQQPPQISSAG